jgi:serine/threonine protein kinase
VSDSPTDHPPYSRLNDRYQILSLIGTGGMASVYKAHDEFLDREVAVKLFDAPLGEITEVTGQQHELQVLARLNHHSLVGLIDAGIVANKNPALSRMYLVMELIAGATLKSLISARRMSGLEIAQLGFDLAEGLQYIHGNGVIHRDVKPANVLTVSYNGSGERRRAKLADFGIALLTGTPAPDDGLTVGTAAYLSPEQAMRENISPESDVYSLGLSLLECFTRTPEFPGTILESATARLIRDPVMPVTLAPQWAQLLAAMTARDPADRPTSAEAVLALGELIGIERDIERGTETSPAAASASPSDASPDDFARVARIGSRLLNAAIVLIVAVDDGVPRLLSHHGVDAHLVQPSALLGNPRDGVSPLLADGSDIRRVEGSPLFAANGRVIGSLWVLDERHHTMSAYDEQNLADVAALAERELERSAPGATPRELRLPRA